MDTWVGQGLGRVTEPADRLRALVGGLFGFVTDERDGWSVLIASGGLDHPALHGVRARWTVALADGVPDQDVAAQAVVASLLLGVGGWVSRGIEPANVLGPLQRALAVD